MGKALLFFLLAGAAWCQPGQLTSQGSFDLGKINAFAATPDRLLSIQIGASSAAIVRTAPDGNSVVERREVSVPFGQIDAAFPQEDGTCWIAAAVPDPRRITTTTPDTRFLQFDLYDRNGNKTESHRIVTRSDLLRRPVAARGASIFTLTGASLIEGDDIRKGKSTGTLDLSAIPGTASFIATADGALIGIDHARNRLIVLDSGGKKPKAYPLQVPAGAVTSADGALYLLSRTLTDPGFATVTKADLTGQVLSSWRCKLENGLVPSRLGVAGDSIYLVDRSGRGERFSTDLVSKH